MPEWPFVSVVILNYNGKEYVRKCLESVLDSDYPNFEVLFVDNRSSDGSLELVERLFHSHKLVKIIRNSENLGFAGGNNVASKLAKGECLVFLNMDMEVDKRGLRELVGAMVADPTIGVAQGKLMFAHDREIINSAGGFIDGYCWAFERGKGQVDRGQYDRVDEIFYAVGGMMIVRKEAFEDVGMFDPEFFLYYDDVDLCWRMWLGKNRVIYVPTAVAYHALGGSTRRVPLLSYFHFQKNHISTMIKNYEPKNLTRYLTVHLAWTLLTAIFHLLTGGVERGIANVRAVFWNVSNFRHVWRERLRIQHAVRKISDEELIHKFRIDQKFVPLSWFKSRPLPV